MVDEFLLDFLSYQTTVFSVQTLVAAIKILDQHFTRTVAAQVGK